MESRTRVTRSSEPSGRSSTPSATRGSPLPSTTRRPTTFRLCLRTRRARLPLGSGNLPTVGFVNAVFDNSEHPPHDAAAGEKFVHDVVAAFAQSSAWSSSALLVTYDEAGGFFDHVPPPPACVPDALPENADFDRLGIRIPFVVVSGIRGHDARSTKSIRGYAGCAGFCTFPPERRRTGSRRTSCPRISTTRVAWSTATTTRIASPWRRALRCREAPG